MDQGTEFTRAEYEGRIERLRNEMRARAVDVVLIDDCEILNYFVGYDTSLNLYRACLISLDNDPVMVLRALDVSPFLEQAWFEDHVGFADHEEPVEAVAATIASRGFAQCSIGYDPGSHGMSVAHFETLRHRLPGARFVAMFQVPWELRLIKSDAEIARIERASTILDQTMAETIAYVAPGVTARGIAAIAARRFLELGGDAGHIGLIAAARGWDFLHAPFHNDPLQKGDVLHLELVSRYRGYDARMMRCVALGPVDAERQRAADTLIALQNAQISAMKPGALSSDVDAVLRQGVIAAGLRAEYPNVTGYTLGYYSKLPIRSSDFTRAFSPTAKWTIEAGMIFHMYTSAMGVAISETVCVRSEGAERLTKLQRCVFSNNVDY